MNDQHDDSLRGRVERLEKIIEDLQRSIQYLNEKFLQKSPDIAVPKSETGFQPKTHEGDLTVAPTSPQLKTVAFKPHEETIPAPKTTDPAAVIKKSEYWFNKVGIGLLLLGVAFLFKYSVDQGWLTPPLRVGIGLFLGLILLIIGIRIHPHRRHFSQVLLGGGIATFYITGFAAFQLFDLVSYPVAFSFLIFNTILGFFFSLYQNVVVLSLIGAIGGFGTPFLLYTGAGSLPGLVGYTCLVLSGTTAIYFIRGWRSLLWTSVIGGWVVFLLTSYIQSISHDTQQAHSDPWALQIGIIFGLLVFWVFPVIREVLFVRNPARWRPPLLDSLGQLVSPNVRKFVNGHVHVLVVSTPLIGLIFSMRIWALTFDTCGWITMAGAAVYAFASWYLKRYGDSKPLAYTHAITSLLLLTIAFCLILEGDTLFFTLAVEAVALHFISRRLLDRGTLIGAHLLFGAVGVWLGIRLFLMNAQPITILNAQALTDFVIIITGLSVSVLIPSREVRRVYQISAHIAILAWISRELSVLPNGQAYITITWGIYAIALLILGLRFNLNQVRIVALVTLVLVVSKLFLVDLSELEPIWRILLFLGFGGLFLILSYYYRALSQSTTTSSESGS